MLRSWPNRIEHAARVNEVIMMGMMVMVLAAVIIMLVVVIEIMCNRDNMVDLLDTG